MARFPKASPRQAQSANPLATAQEVYGAAFGSTHPRELAESLADWSELEPSERAFASAHLNYLNLRAQGVTQRLLREMVALLEGIEEGVDVFADAQTSEPPVRADVSAPEPAVTPTAPRLSEAPAAALQVHTATAPDGEA